MKRILKGLMNRGKGASSKGIRFDRLSYLWSMIFRHRLEMTLLKELLGLLGKRVEDVLALFLAAYLQVCYQGDLCKLVHR